MHDRWRSRQLIELPGVSREITRPRRATKKRDPLTDFPESPVTDTAVSESASESPHSQLGHCLKAARQARGLTLKQVAEKTGMALSTLSKVGPGIAKRLGLLQLTYVAKINEVDPVARTIEAERRSEGGVQVLKTKLPCLVTMLEATNEIRRGAMADALRAARAQIVTWSAKDAGVEDISKCGLKGSPTIVKRVFAPSARAEKATIVDFANRPPAEALIEELFKRQPKLEAELISSAHGF